jgi:alpha-mannosidase
MALTSEWRHRVENWRKELPNHFYRPLGSVPVKGFVTKEQLSTEEALERDFRPMPTGTTWGGKWEYGWFQGKMTLPEEAAGERIVLKMDVGGESAVYLINADESHPIAIGAVDWAHQEITLVQSGVPGTTYKVLLEAYAGHGPRVTSAGPVPPDRETVPEPPPAQTVVSESTFGIWEEDVYQLWMDVETLWDVRENIDQESLRVAEIDAGLRDFTLIVDFELEHAEMLETVRAGQERLKPLLACINGSTAPTMFAFGHAHIDVAWLWPLAETERKCVRTFASQLALMEEYPEYRFLQSQPHLYWMVKTHYPRLYERVKAAVDSGQWIADGGTWVEPDTNISGGEGLIRQFLHGKRFYREEFGVECEMLWLPDVFGYSGALPQIMRGCGIKYFSTHKLFWTYNGADPFPYNTFTWEGIDGSEVLVHLHYDYNARTNPATLIERWRERVQKDGLSTRMLPFGWGDGGGGPTRNHLEFLRRERDLEGVPKARIGSPMDYFKDQEARGWPEARYVGELYFQAHRGTYTSQAKTKLGNRRSEFALREAEMWGAAAQVLSGFEYPGEEMDTAWRAVLLNQFHDIIPGSSIQRVYEEAQAAYAEVIETAEAVARRAAGSLADDPEALTVFNSLSWNRTGLVALPKGWEGAVDGTGTPLPAQMIDDKAWVQAAVPACGWTTLRRSSGEALRDSAPGQPSEGITASEQMLENEKLRVTFNKVGEITSLFDKESGRELAAGLCNSLRMYKDVPADWDAWDIDSTYQLAPVELGGTATIQVVTSGPLLAVLRVTRQLHHSTMTQEISLRRESRRIDFHTVIDWQESHKLLKVNFPVTIHANEGVHEIQFGHIRRPNHHSRPFDADRFEVSNHKWTALMEENRGCAVLNDCKYGVNVLGNSINLTLLKSALAPDMTADKGRQGFTYAFYAWNGPFATSPVVQKAYELNQPVRTIPGAAGERSLFSVDAPNVIIETVKPAEDRSGDVVVRLYEAKRTATRCRLSTSLDITAAVQTDMLENGNEALPLADGQIGLEFRPFEIKTIKLRPGSVLAASRFSATC